MTAPVTADRPGAPGTWDREVHFAFALADRRYRTGGRRRLVPPYRYGNVYITAAAARLPFGRSTHHRAYLTHLITAVYVAWRDGRVVASHARWRCGAGTTHFRLINEPDSVVCPACTLERVPAERGTP